MIEEVVSDLSYGEVLNGVTDAAVDPCNEGVEDVTSVPTSLSTAECTRITTSLIVKFINEQSSIDITTHRMGGRLLTTVRRWKHLCLV